MNERITTTFDKLKCIDLPHNNSANGNHLQIWNCLDNSAQEFSYNPTTLQIKHLPSDKCIDLDSNKQDNGSKIQLWDCNGAVNQRWIQDGKLFKLHNTNKCIDIPNANFESGNKLQLYECNNSIAQQFEYTIHPCDNPNIKTNSQLQSACDCRNALVSLKKSQTVYQNQMNKYNNDIAHYNNQLEKHTRWRNKSDEYSHWKNRQEQLQNEAKPWKNCVHWAQAAASAEHGWCANDFGANWYHSGATGEGCSIGFGKGLCKITYTGIDNILRSEGYYSQEPVIPIKPVIPNPPTGNNILCCSQSFSNISASNVNFDNISQNCSQTINNIIKDALKPPPVSPPQVNTQPPPPVSAPLPLNSPTLPPVSPPQVNNQPPPVSAPLPVPLPINSTSSSKSESSSNVLIIVLIIILIVIISLILKFK